ncbi:hypothetical protein MWU59_12060 [Flavobacteriaceae bacterium F08102]|nr:hypothetical protein [Flavobacteriaceae bacterium F08102]
MVQSIKKKSQRIKNSKKTKVFLLCLALAFLIWVPIKLSKLYNGDFYFELKIGELPKDKLLLSPPPKMVEIAVDGMSGYYLLRNRMNPPKIDVDLKNIHKVRGHTYYLATQTLMGDINRHLPSDIKVLSLKPDSLFFDLGVSKTRKIPVEVDLKIDFKQGFNLVNEITVSPKEIEVTGPENIIDTLTVLRTEQKEFLELNKPIALTVPIVKLDSKEVRYNQTTVQLAAEVEEFTEARLTMPFTIANVPSDVEVTTFPNEVEIVFQIPISAYKEIDKNDFKIGCDFRRSQKNELSYLIPVMLSQPDFVSSVRIIPDQIEFFISQ